MIVTGLAWRQTQAFTNRLALMFRWGGLKGTGDKAQALSSEMSFQRCPPPLEALFSYNEKKSNADTLATI